MEYVWSILALLLGLVAVVMSYYAWIRNKLETGALDAINDAEALEAAGAEKMQHAVETVYGLVPAVLRPFISKTTVQAILQNVFDRVEVYAQKQVEKKSVK